MLKVLVDSIQVGIESADFLFGNKKREKDLYEGTPSGLPSGEIVYVRPLFILLEWPS